MAGKKLEVSIGADISDFQKKISEVEFDLKELSKLKIERIKLGLDTSEINKNITDVKKTLRDLKSTTTDAGNSFGTFNKKTADGGAALTSFSRIAQDAPYGIIGVGNNITNTAEQFGALVKQTGSAGGALKALLSSLSGVGGILLGVSLLTTGLTLLSQRGLTVGDVIDKLTGKYNEFGDSIKKASEEGAKAAATEVGALQSLVSVAQNDTLTKKERLIAVDKLQKQFPGYYGQLNDEKILYGDLTEVTRQATKALIDRAIAEKLIGSNADIFVERLKANARYKQAAEELNAFDKKAEKDLADAKGSSAAQIAQIQARQLNTRNSLIDKINTERDNIVRLTASYERLQNVINKLSASSIKLNQQASTGGGNKGGETPQVSKANTGIEQQPIVVKPFDTTAIKASVEEIKKITGEGYLSIAELTFLFSEDLNKLVDGSITSAFENLGNSIGQALATGGNIFEAIGSSLLQSLGNFISDMGSLLIKYGTLAVVKGKLDVAIAAGGPVSIGAGLAAIAVGVALKAVGGAISSKATSGGGGRVSSSGGSNASYSSSSSGYSGGGMSGNVVFEISGQKLIGVLNNTLNGNKRLGGAVGLG